MVQTKHQKSKSKKQVQTKKHGKQVDISEFRGQLDALGLKIVQVTADGNCFFRAVADQLEGNEEEHEKYRSMVVQYIVKNREMFEPFIEDDAPFDEYCQSMGKDGTWAGHMEVQAASLVTRKNICIHHHMSPRWYIRNFDNQGASMIHLSYHDGEHYNSVRLKEDPCDGPARPIIIKADVNLTASLQQPKAAGAPSKARSSKNVAHGGAVKMVMAGSGCEDATKVEQVLLQVDGDIDVAIEFLIAEREAGETLDGSGEKDRNGDNENPCYHKHEMESDFGSEKDLPRIKNRFDDEIKSCKADKVQKIPRNKVCPCGSKKKYKACCGVASGRTYSKLVVDHAADSSRGKGGNKQAKKVGKITKASSRSDEVLPDMGALCI